MRSLAPTTSSTSTREDFTQRRGRYDLLVDIVGNHSLAEFRCALKPRGTFVMVGGIAAGGGRLLCPAAQVLRGPWPRAS